jgi:hypothetical protein
MYERRVPPSRVSIGVGLLGAGLIGSLALTAGEPRADVIDPTVAKTITVGNGALAACDRANPARNGRVTSLPVLPKVRWQQHKLGARIEQPPAVAADGTVVIVTAPGSGSLESTLLDLGPNDGATKSAVKIEPVAAAPIILGNGIRVVVTMRGDAIGADGGSIRFRTALGGEFASVQRVALVPLPSGGFGIARRGELIEIDGSGAIVGRTRFDTPSSPSLAVRSNGDLVAVTPGGELHTWRAGRLPHLVGTFGEKDKVVAAGAQLCQWGPVVDFDPTGGSTGRRERAICVSESLVEAIDLGNGTRRALLARTLIPFRSAAAVGAGGEVVVAGAGGMAMGLGATGVEFGPIDLPGITTVLPTSKDAGAGTLFFSSSSGEIAPLIGADSSILYGSSDGLAIVRGGSLPIRVPRCGGTLTGMVAGVAPAGPSTLAIAFGDGCVEVVTDVTAKK